MGRLVGRDAELQTAATFLDDLDDGPAAMILAGEAGIGKSTIWRYTLDMAADRGYRVLSCRPVPAEAKLSYTTLSDLAGPIAGAVLGHLPDPQRHALEGVLLMSSASGNRPDQRSTSMAFLSALDVLLEDAPVVIGIDDARWVDQPSARILRFAFRRLGQRRVGTVLCTPSPDEVDVPLGLYDALDPEHVWRLGLGPLSVGALYQAIVAGVGISVSRPMLLRIHRASRGNPLLALEMARALEGARPPPPGKPLPVPTSLRKLFTGRIAALSPATRRSLLYIAAIELTTVERILELTGECTWNAAGGAEAEAAGVVEVDQGRVRFCHPLLGSATYEAATVETRRAVHRRIADIATNLEEHASHLALATSGTDEEVAQALSAGATWAWQRGASEHAADLAELAVVRTPTTSPSLYTRRIEAARYLFEAGDADRARMILEQAVAAESGAKDRAEGLWRLGQLHHRQDNYDVAVELLGLARQESIVGDVLTAAIERDLALATMMQGDLYRAAIHGRTAVNLAQRAEDPVLIEEASTTLLLIEFLLGTARPNDLPSSFIQPRSATDEPLGFRSGVILASVLKWMGDLDEARARFDEEYRWATQRGAGAHLPSLLGQMSDLERLAGNWGQAAAHAEEAVEAALLTRSDYAVSVALSVRGRIAACLGRVDESRRDLEEGLALAEKVGAPLGVLRNCAALGFLELSLGDAEAAHRRLAPLIELMQSMSMAEPALMGHVPDGIESLVALDRFTEAGSLLEWFEEQISGTERVSAIAAASRCRAILLAAEGHLQEALAALDCAQKGYGALGLPLALGRTLLVKGRILRRARERRAAKDVLEEALRLFEGLGARLWAAKVTAELSHLDRVNSVHAGLTPTEARVAELAAAGRTNREIAEELFVGVKSVEAHLSRVYSKLAVRSRTQLGAVLRTSGPPIPS